MEIEQKPRAIFNDVDEPFYLVGSLTGVRYTGNGEKIIKKQLLLFSRTQIQIHNLEMDCATKEEKLYLVHETSSFGRIQNIKKFNCGVANQDGIIILCDNDKVHLNSFNKFEDNNWDFQQKKSGV